MGSASTITEFAPAHAPQGTFAEVDSLTTEVAGNCPASVEGNPREKQVVPQEFDRNQVILRHLPDVKLIATRIHRRLPSNVELEDLIQAGILGLIDAVERVDTSRPVSPDQYIRIRVTGAIFDSLRGQDWVSRYMRSRQQKLRDAADRAQNRLGRSVTTEDIAGELNMDLDSYFEFAAAVQELRRVEPQAFNDSGDFVDAAEILPAPEAIRPDHSYLKQEMREVITKVLEDLPRDESRVLRLYYFEEWTMREIAARIRRTESRVSQIHAKGLSHVAERLSAHPCTRRPLESHPGRTAGEARKH